MRFIQISDLHVVASGEKLYNFVDSNAACAKAIAQINAVPELDFVLITGDTVNNGGPAQYAMLENILAGLHVPAYVIPGNHDDPNLLRHVAQGKYHQAQGMHMDYVIDTYALRIIMLDTTKKGELYGWLEQEQLQWLNTQLAADTRPTLICIHHPPCKLGNAHMDTIRMLNGADFIACIQKHSHITAVACGHTHRSIFFHVQGIPFFTAPSLTAAIETNIHDDRGFFSPNNSKYLMHTYDAQNGLISFEEDALEGMYYSFAHINKQNH